MLWEGGRTGCSGAAQPPGDSRRESDPSQLTEWGEAMALFQVINFGGESQSSSGGHPGPSPELLLLSEPAPPHAYFLSPVPVGLGSPALARHSWESKSKHFALHFISLIKERHQYLLPRDPSELF